MLSKYYNAQNPLGSFDLAHPFPQNQCWDMRIGYRSIMWRHKSQFFDKRAEQVQGSG